MQAAVHNACMGRHTMCCMGMAVPTSGTQAFDSRAQDICGALRACLHRTTLNKPEVHEVTILVVMATDSLPAMARAEKISMISKLVFDHCVAPHTERIRQTGSILPTSSLRHKSTRDTLSWAKDLDQGRYFTHALVRDVLTDILETHKVDLPCTPGFSQQKWVEDQSRILHKCLKKARRKSTASPAMDPSTLETQPWDYGELDEEEAGFLFPIACRQQLSWQVCV